LRKILAFASVVELATGVALMAAPAVVARLLLGAALSGVGIPVGRCFGIALVALALACWPGASGSGRRPAAFAGMLAYNALIAVYLSALGAGGRADGALLWPAAVLHAAVGLALAWTGRAGRQAAT
jgi:hypothetical protein